MRYRDAGVDVPRAEAVKRSMARAVRSTWGPRVRPLPAGFAGLIAWPAGGALLAASMDGVGTKLHLALRAGRVADAAADLVYHGTNDLICHGATPLAFLDYVAQSRLEPDTVLAVVEGLARACRASGCALLGGETAQMPDTYLPGVVDVAGCMLGVVDPAHVLDGSAVQPADLLLGLGSDGLHTNGFSLARKVLAKSGLALDAPLPGGAGESVGEALLARHRPYLSALCPLLAQRRLRALAHVTGGGLAGTLARVLPEGCRARVRSRAWTWPAAFRWLAQAGPVALEEMRETFNLGVGMVACVAPAEADGVAAALRAAGERVFVVGEVVPGERGVEWVD
jgi:phosphoribosylformylglycinamidine cyclo-ligase